MYIDFKNKKIQKLAQNSKLLCQKYGPYCGELIIISLDYLSAAASLQDVPAAIRPHPLKGRYKGKFAVDIKHPYRIIFAPVGDYNIDNYSTIKSIIIIDLGLS
jgi:proteic killer suppression protein